MSRNVLKDQIIKEHLIPYKCARCGCDGTWQGQILSLQLHHKDGNHQNNDLSNLEFLCPNCHSLTDSWCKNGRENSFNKDAFIEEIKNGKTIRQALLSIGLSDGSANYKTAYHILEEEKLDYQRNKGSETRCMICGKIITPGAKYCRECYDLLKRRTERPDPDVLLEKIATSSFLAVANLYGVTDNTIRKWCKAYDLPTHKKDIVKLYQEKMPR